MSTDEAYDAMQFEDTLKTVDVKIGDRDYVLVEASGGSVVEYRNFIMENTELQDGKAKKMRGIADAEPRLLAKCLFLVKTNDDGTKTREPVHVDKVRSWPNRIQRTLFDRLRRISDLDETDDDTIQTLQNRIDELKKQEAQRGNE